MTSGIEVSAVFLLNNLTNARYNPERAEYFFSAEERLKLRKIVSDRSRSAFLRAACALLLTVPQSKDEASEAGDYIYRWAVIADGGAPQRETKIEAQVRVSEEEKECLLEALRDPSLGIQREKVAIALGRAGVFIEELIAPLIEGLTSPHRFSDERDQLLAYLVGCGGPQVVDFLKSMFRDPGSNSDYFNDSFRVFLATCGLGDVGLIRERIEDGFNENGEIKAYCFVLSGVESPAGVAALRELLSDRRELVQRAATAALNRHWVPRPPEEAPQEEFAQEEVALEEGAQEEDHEPEDSVLEGSAVAPVEGPDAAETSGSEEALTGPQQIIAEKSVFVLLVRGQSLDGDPIYAFLAIRADKLPEFIEAQKAGTFFPEDFGIIVESGPGEPSDEVYAKMRDEYGFNREGMLNIPDVSAAYDLTKRIAEISNPVQKPE